jgi:hypothetical protein
VIVPTAPIAAISDAKKPRPTVRRAHIPGHEPPHTSPARSTA